MRRLRVRAYNPRMPNLSDVIDRTLGLPAGRLLGRPGVLAATIASLALSFASCGGAPEARPRARPGASPEAILGAGYPWAAIPGLSEGFVPQGLAVDEAGGRVVVSGWFSDGGASALYALDLEGRAVGSARLEEPDGAPYRGHAGGAAFVRGELYVSSEGALWRLAAAELERGLAEGRARFADRTLVPTRASFCAASGDTLWVGDFERGSAYPTEPWRSSVARDGDRRKAWIAAYDLSGSGAMKDKPVDAEGRAVPDRVVSIGGSVQGAAFQGGRVYLSRSFGRYAASTLLSYDDPESEAPHAGAAFGGRELPLRYLDGLNLRGIMAMPPMSEGLAALDGRLLVLFESAARPYLSPGDARARPVDRIWSLDPALLP